MRSETKICAKCKVEKSVDDFHKSSVSADGLKARCIDCRKKDAADYYEANREIILTRNTGWRRRNPDKELARSRRNYLARDVEEDRIRQRESRARHPARHQEYRRRAEAKSRSTPKGRIDDAMRAGVRRGIIQGARSGRRTYDILGYSPEDLMAHLERLFLPGMTWGNYGQWHIDHVHPLASFAYDTPDCPGFKAAWALSNLQPLWAVDNKVKGKSVRPSSTERAAA